MLLRLLTVAAAAIGFAQTASAGDKLVQKVYHVADLVVPIPDNSTTDRTSNSCPAACPTDSKSAKTCEAELIKLIRTTIAPSTWADAGGRGTIEYYPVGLALVASQTPDVHEQIVSLLESLRKLQEREITFEVKFVQVPETAFERIGIDFDLSTSCGDCKVLQPQVRHVQDPLQSLAIAARWQPQRAIVLNDKQVSLLLEAFQGERRTNVLAAPKITAFEGQTARVQIGETHRFITDVKETKVNDQSVWVPQQTTEFIGTDLALQGSITTDGKLVCVHVRGAVSNLDPVTPLVPVTSTVNPIYEVGAQGVPIAFTQYIQKPRIEKLVVEKTLAIPNGGTALIHCGEMTTTTRCEYGCPVLSKVPYINRLFKNVGIGNETCHLLMLVTPRARIGCGEEQAEKGACGGCLGSSIGGLIGCAKTQPCQATAPAAASCPAKPRGSLRIGIGVNSDGGLTGSIILNERNFNTKCCQESPSCSLQDVANMAKAGISDDVIVNQIRTTKSRYTLTSEQIIWLHENAVGERVIIEMQYTRPGTNESAPGTLSSFTAPQSNRTKKDELEALGDLGEAFGLLLGETLGIRIVNEYSSEPNERMMKLLNESEDIRQLDPKVGHWWWRHQSSPPTLTYDRLSGSIGP